MRRAIQNSKAIQSLGDAATLPEAPTLWPTAEEFAQPLRYIASVRQHCEKYGACKIVPPAGWRPAAPASELDEDATTFVPRLMPIHKLQQGCGFQMDARTSLRQFREKADAFKAFEVLDLHTSAAAAAPAEGEQQQGAEAAARAAEVAEEALFWRTVQTAETPLVVPYGADLDTETHGSGFGENEARAPNIILRRARNSRDDTTHRTPPRPTARQACAGWNLRHLARRDGSLLRMTAKVPGVSSPWLCAAARANRRLVWVARAPW